LKLYYRNRYELSLDQGDNQYIATLIIKL
jgi:hypothetical protein